MKIVTFLTGVALIAAGCSGIKAEVHTDFKNVPLETIDFFGFSEGEVETIPDSYKHNPRYIPLSAGDGKYLFGQADKVVLSNDRIYVMDSRSRRIIVFDMEGNPIANVGRQGRGPGEYITIADFDVDEKGNVIVVDGNQDVLLTYDKNYDFLSSVKPAFDIDAIKCLPDDKLLINLTTWNMLSYKDTQLLVTDMDLNVEKKYLNYGEYIDNNFIISRNIITETPGGILYNQTNNNNVYSFTPQGVPQKLYTFDFGTKNVPDEYKKDVEGNLEKYKNLCLLLKTVFIDDNYIMGWVYLEGKSRIFLIDKKSGVRYTEEINDGNMLLIGFSGNTAISLLSPGEWDEVKLEGLPENVISHLKAENFVLSLYDLK